MLLGYSYFAEQEEDVYRFIFCTGSGIKYSVYFYRLSEYFGHVELPLYLSTTGFIFGIARIVDNDYKPLPLDSRIKYTVRDILQDFFTNYKPEAVLVINYDDYDGKQNKRFINFNQWFESLNDEKVLFKEDTTIILPKAEVKLSLLFQTNHPHFTMILEEFHEAKNRLIEEKE